MGSPNFWRGVVRNYVQRFPVSRGKRRVMEMFAPLYAGSEPQTCRLPGGAQIRVDLAEHVQRWIYFFGAYEAETVSWFRSVIRPGMTVLDIGAHVGQYSLIAASDVGPTGRVHSFEPNPVSHGRLRANLEMNGFRNVTPHQLAVSDSAGEVTLYVPRHDNLGEASLQPCQEGMQEVKVRCVTIDEWAETADLGTAPRIDLVKIDVQGLEAKVLQGARHTLTRFKPLVICEFEERWLRGMGTSSVELKKMLGDMGYRVNRITPGGLAPVADDQIHGFDNLVLVPAGHPLLAARKS
jgi:FkbM family methyltransferase